MYDCKYMTRLVQGIMVGRLKRVVLFAALLLLAVMLLSCSLDTQPYEPSEAEIYRTLMGFVQLAQMEELPQGVRLGFVWMGVAFYLEDVSTVYEGETYVYNGSIIMHMKSLTKKTYELDITASSDSLGGEITIDLETIDDGGDITIEVCDINSMDYIEDAQLMIEMLQSLFEE